MYSTVPKNVFNITQKCLKIQKTSLTVSKKFFNLIQKCLQPYSEMSSAISRYIFSKFLKHVLNPYPEDKLSYQSELVYWTSKNICGNLGVPINIHCIISSSSSPSAQCACLSFCPGRRITNYQGNCSD